MPRRIESHFIPGPAGRLEALLEEPEDREPVECALVCHPHPQHGGTMHNKVVYRIARGLRKIGSAVLRFNYRGVNLSEGAYGGSEGELDDARACLDWLRTRYPELPYSIAGFSFGSRVALRLACERGEARRVIAVGFPESYHANTPLDTCRAPKVFIQSTHDQYGPIDSLGRFVAALPPPKELHEVPARDHFFAGALDQLEQVIAALAR